MNIPELVKEYPNMKIEGCRFCGYENNLWEATDGICFKCGNMLGDGNGS